jgi:light-regulated signal transduction histidine kinase (bacteriophytochrome)
MSYAILRSVSVMYSDYLKNMGVKSTMVMPLMKEGALWGLISAMHHSAPRRALALSASGLLRPALA